MPLNLSLIHISPAIGFAIASDQLLAAIQRQKTEITTDKEYQLLLYPRKLQKEAILKAQELRKTGALIELLCMDETKSKENYQAYADRTGITPVSYTHLKVFMCNIKIPTRFRESV